MSTHISKVNNASIYWKQIYPVSRLTCLSPPSLSLSLSFSLISSSHTHSLSLSFSLSLSLSFSLSLSLISLSLSLSLSPSHTIDWFRAKGERSSDTQISVFHAIALTFSLFSLSLSLSLFLSLSLSLNYKQPIKTRYLGHVAGYQPIRDQYFLIRSVSVGLENQVIRVIHKFQTFINYKYLKLLIIIIWGAKNIIIMNLHFMPEPTDTSKQQIKTRYLGHVAGYQPIRDQYFLIRSVSVGLEISNFHQLQIPKTINYHYLGGKEHNNYESSLHAGDKLGLERRTAFFTKDSSSCMCNVRLGIEDTSLGIEDTSHSVQTEQSNKMNGILGHIHNLCTVGTRHSCAAVYQEMIVVAGSVAVSYLDYSKLLYTKCLQSSFHVILSDINAKDILGVPQNVNLLSDVRPGRNLSLSSSQTTLSFSPPLVAAITGISTSWGISSSSSSFCPYETVIRNETPYHAQLMILLLSKYFLCSNLPETQSNQATDYYTYSALTESSVIEDGGVFLVVERGSNGKTTIAITGICLTESIQTKPSHPRRGRKAQPHSLQ
eukprot:sb/3463643/